MSTFVNTHSTELPNLQLLLRQKEHVKLFSGASTSANYLTSGANGVSISSSPVVNAATSAWNQPDQSSVTCGALNVTPHFSADGKYVCYVSTADDHVRIYDATNTSSSEQPKLIQQFECQDVLSVEFSPLGTYLVTWSRPFVTGKTSSSSSSSTPTGNLRVWDVTSGTLLCHYSQKTQKKDVIQWSHNEHLCMKIVNNEVHIMDGHDLAAGIKSKVYYKNVTQFKLAYVGDDTSDTAVAGTPHYCEVGCFAAAHGGGSPAQVAIFRVILKRRVAAGSAISSWWVSNNSSSGADSAVADTVEVVGPLVSRGSMLGATEATLQWNAPLNNTLLVFTRADVDSSGSSYYGRTGAFLLAHPAPAAAVGGSSKFGAAPVAPATSGASSKTAVANVSTVTTELSLQVPMTKAGPAYDMAWSPTGLNFILVGGTMPSNSTLYNIKGDALYEFGTAHRNTVVWSPHGRFFCIAGLGNLAGDVDFYELTVEPKFKVKKIGSTNAHCTVQYGWSPDSRYFMAATLAPRMNVDNGFKVFKYNGSLVFSHDCASASAASTGSNSLAYDCLWRPTAKTAFPNRPRSPPPTGSAGTDDAAAGGAGSTAPRDNAAATAKPAAPVAAAPYRPRGSTGALADMMRRSSGAVTTAGKVTPPVPAGGTSSPKVAVGVNPVGAYKPPERRIPGMAPAPAAAAAGGPKKGGSGGKAKETSGKPSTPPVAPQTASPPAAAAAPAVAEDLEKKSKNLRKKLRQIEDLQKKKDAGETMSADQQAKLDSKGTIEAELAALAI